MPELNGSHEKTPTKAVASVGVISPDGRFWRTPSPSSSNHLKAGTVPVNTSNIGSHGTESRLTNHGDLQGNGFFQLRSRSKGLACRAFRDSILVVKGMAPRPMA